MDPEDDQTVEMAARFDAAEHQSYDNADLHALRVDASLPEDFRADENAIFLARQLDYVRARTYTRRFPLMSGTALVPNGTEIPEWAETITQRVYDEVGMAKIIANYADDLPRADVRMKEMTTRVHDVGASYGYSIAEMRASRALGTGLDARKGAAARRSIEEKLNRIRLLGDSDHGLYGLLNHPNIPAVLSLNGNWSDSATTAQDIYDDLVALYTAIHDQSNGTHTPNRLAWTAKDRIAASTKLIPDSGGRSAWQMFAQNFPGITPVDVYEFKGAGPGGTSNRILMYDYSEENLRFELVMAFNQLPAQVRNLETVVPCLARTGGIQIDYPLSMAQGNI